MIVVLVVERKKIKMEVIQNFKVEMSKKLNDKIEWLTNNYDNEIGAWLIGEITNEKIIIEDFLIPNQEVGTVSVDTSGKALVELRKEYGDKCKKIIGHFHSHNTMSADWSFTDEDFIKEFTAPREKAVFIVSSQKDKHRIRLELTKPFKISLDELKYKILYGSSKMGDELNKIIKKKCNEEKISSWKDDELTKKEVNKMVSYEKSTHNVIVRDLTLNQFYQLEGVFPVEQEGFNSGKGKITMLFKTTTKKEAIKLIVEIKDYMIDKLKEDINEEDINENEIDNITEYCKDYGVYPNGI